MKVLFNHGMTIPELYSNTPKSITDKKWIWFINRYGSSSSYDDAISEPFKYALYLVFNKILDDKMRFRLPVIQEAYIDFEIVTDDKFIEQRQNGRFQNIDFVQSDFTGYAVRYYFNSPHYKKSYQIYFGGDLKRKFINKINSGEKFYTIRDFKIQDILEQIEYKFKDLTKSEILKIVSHGFRRLHSAMRFGCAISLIGERQGNVLAFIGNFTMDPKKQILDYSLKRDRKLRKITMWKKLRYDGYYYIGLNPSAFSNWIELNKKSRWVVKFENIVLRRLKEELFYKHREIYIFKIKIKKYKGWSFYMKNIKSEDVTYMGKVDNLKYFPSFITWKQLIKEYETRNSLNI